MFLQTLCHLHLHCIQDINTPPPPPQLPQLGLLPKYLIFQHKPSMLSGFLPPYFCIGHSYAEGTLRAPFIELICQNSGPNPNLTSSRKYLLLTIPGLESFLFSEHLLPLTSSNLIAQDSGISQRRA